MIGRVRTQTIAPVAVFRKHELTLEQPVARARHQAEEQGNAFDPDSVTEPSTYSQVKATGAVVD
jgi:hypothetical protein